MVVQEQIKALIINLMLHTPPSVRAQVSEALTIISSHDFPARWQGLLPELIAKLESREQVRWPALPALDMKRRWSDPRPLSA